MLPRELAGLEVDRREKRRSERAGRAVDEIAEPQRVQERELRPAVEPELFGFGVRADLLQSIGAASGLVARGEEEHVVGAPLRRAEIEVVPRIVDVRPEKRAGIRIEPVDRRRPRRSRVAGWPSNVISIGGASEVRKCPLFHATLPSRCRNAITACPGPPTKQMMVSFHAIGLQPYPALTTGRINSVGAPNSFTRSCDQTTLPVRLSKACSCLFVPNVKRRSPTRIGVEWGPARG